MKFCVYLKILNCYIGEEKSQPGLTTGCSITCHPCIDFPEQPWEKHRWHKQKGHTNWSVKAGNS